MIQLAWHGPDTRGDLEATYAADVFSYALSQTGSRFQEALVESGVALGASLSYSTQRYVGPIFLTLQTLPGGEEAAIRAALAEVARFADEDYVTDAQIAAAQTILATDALYDQLSDKLLAPHYSLDLNDKEVGELIYKAYQECEVVGDVEFLEDSYFAGQDFFDCPKTWA